MHVHGGLRERALHKRGEHAFQRLLLRGTERLAEVLRHVPVGEKAHFAASSASS